MYNVNLIGNQMAEEGKGAITMGGNIVFESTYRNSNSNQKMISAGRMVPSHSLNSCAKHTHVYVCTCA